MGALVCRRQFCMEFLIKYDQMICEHRIKIKIALGLEEGL